MKFKLMLILPTMMFSLNSFAIEKQDQTNCVSSNNETGACIQNKTGAEMGGIDLQPGLNNIVLLMKIMRAGASQPIISALIIPKTADNHFIDISWTTDELKKFNLVSIDYTLVQDTSYQQNSPLQSKLNENYYGRLIPGCHLIVPQVASKLILQLYKDDKGLLFCKPL